MVVLFSNSSPRQESGSFARSFLPKADVPAAGWNGKTVALSCVSFNLELRLTHIERCAPQENLSRGSAKRHQQPLCPRGRNLVLDVAGYHCNITRDHRPPIAPDTEIHLALDHPNNLLMRMPMCGGMRTRLHFPPHDHSLIPRGRGAQSYRRYAPHGSSYKCAEARHHRHNVSLRLQGLSGSGQSKWR